MHQFLSPKKIMEVNYVNRSDIIQHRLCSEKGNNYWRCDPSKRSGKCVKGEECSVLALFNFCNFCPSWCVK